MAETNEPDRISCYRKAGVLAAEALDYGCSLVKEGILLLDVAEQVEKYIVSRGGKPAFPVNIAVNSVAAHFSPFCGSKEKFARGDIVKIDVGVHFEGYIGDTARTIEVGGSRSAGKLIRASEEALRAAIEIISTKISLERVGAAIESTIQSFGYEPISNLSGHGLARYVIHSGISIPNISEPVREHLKEGMAVAIEPFATDGEGVVRDGSLSSIYRMVGTEKTPLHGNTSLFSRLTGKHCSGEELTKFSISLADNFRTLPFSERWCRSIDEGYAQKLQILTKYNVLERYPVLVERSGGLVSQCEHTVLITENGCEILTRNVK